MEITMREKLKELRRTLKTGRSLLPQRVKTQKTSDNTSSVGISTAREKRENTYKSRPVTLIARIRD